MLTNKSCWLFYKRGYGFFVIGLGLTQPKTENQEENQGQNAGPNQQHESGYCLTQAVNRIFAFVFE